MKFLYKLFVTRLINFMYKKIQRREMTNSMHEVINFNYNQSNDSEILHMSVIK